MSLVLLILTLMATSFLTRDLKVVSVAGLLGLLSLYCLALIFCPRPRPGTGLLMTGCEPVSEGYQRLPGINRNQEQKLFLVLAGGSNQQGPTLQILTNKTFYNNLDNLV